MNELLDNPLFAVLVGAVPSFILGILAYRRSQKVDKATEQSAIANTHRDAIGQVITGLNQLIDNLQTDNKELRDIIADLGIKLKEVVDERDIVVAELHELQKTFKPLVD